MACLFVIVIVIVIVIGGLKSEGLAKPHEGERFNTRYAWAGK